MCLTGLRRVAVPGAAFAAWLLAAPGVSLAGDDPGSPAARTVIAASHPLAPAAGCVETIAATLGRPVPVASLGRPIPLGAMLAVAPSPPAPVYAQAAAVAAPPAVSVSDRALAPASYQSPDASQTVTVRSQAPDPAPPLSGPAPVIPPVPPVPPPLSAGDVPPPALGGPGATYGGVAVDQPIKKSFLDRCKDIFNPGSPDSRCGGRFQSDHAFDDSTCGGDLISPVSSPFLFEDPRALTEIRPLFIYQAAPGRNAAFGDGSSEFYGLQARLAFNDRWSLVLNEIGLVSIQPHNSDVGLTDKTGFAEIKIGPKWTFYRNEQAGGVAAFGVTFEFPAGSKSVFQNTGTLSVDPYVSYGKTFGRSSYGTFNFMGTIGFSASVDDERTDYLHTHLHLDYDVLNLHRIYPLIEVNWLHDTSFGKGNAYVGTEGGDLINFGSDSYDGKRDLVTMALGARYKFGTGDHYQLGTAFEFPLTDRKDLEAFRFTLDFIIRY